MAQETAGKPKAISRADAFSDKGVERISVSHYSI
jgi:hypothetical protein